MNIWVSLTVETGNMVVVEPVELFYLFEQTNQLIIKQKTNKRRYKLNKKCAKLLRTDFNNLTNI